MNARKIMDNLKYLDGDEISKSFDSIFKSINFTSKDEIIAFELIVSYLHYKFKKTRNNSYIYQICVLYKRRFKRNHPDILRFSLEALENKEHTDAVVYYCSALISNKQKNESLPALRKLQTNLKDPNNKLVVDIYISTLFWREGEFKNYCKGIQNFILSKSQDFKPYISIPCSTVYLKNEKPTKHKNSIVDKLLDQTEDLSSKSVDYLITVSCDSQYFHKYWKYFYETLKKQNDNFYCRVIVTDNLQPIPIINDDRFNIIQLGISYANKNIGPISSSLRFISALQLIQKYQKPIIVSDFDCAFKSVSLKKLIEEIDQSDIGLRLLKKELVMPWEHITAGFSVFMPTKNSRLFLENVTNFFLRFCLATRLSGGLIKML